MTALPVGDPGRAGEHIEVDRCEQCGGSFLEFFDGEPIRLAREVLVAPGPRAARLPERALLCPDCETELVRRAYLDTEVELSRCEACMAVFVTANELRALAGAVQARPPDPPEPSWLDRLVAMLTSR